MCKSVKSVLAALCGATALAALPAEVLAGPMIAASPTSVGLTTSFEQAYYRGYRRGYYRRGYGIPGGGAPRLASRLAFWARESQAHRATATAIPATAMAAGMAAVRAGSGTPALVGCGAANKTRAWLELDARPQQLSASR